MIGDIKKLLIIPHINVHNANALSSPFTIGFPAMTAWLGAVHAIQRKMNSKNIPVTFSAVGVVSHDADLQTYKGNNDFVHSIIGTGNPLDKTGKRSAFIEEARCHLDVSLVIEFTNISVDEHEHLLSTLAHVLQANIKMAGGDIKHVGAPFVLVSEEGDDVSLRKLQRALMPGYALIERRDLMVEAMSEGADALEALIDHLAIHHVCERDDEGHIVWSRRRKQHNNQSIGWVVPVASGFYGISDLGEAKNQRDAKAPHCFAESMVTLGEFVMPHRLRSPEDFLWRYYHHDNLYLCQQRSQQTSMTTDTIHSTFNESEFDD